MCNAILVEAVEIGEAPTLVNHGGRSTRYLGVPFPATGGAPLNFGKWPAERLRVATLDEGRKAGEVAPILTDAGTPVLPPGMGDTAVMLADGVGFITKGREKKCGEAAWSTSPQEKCPRCGCGR